MGGYPPGTSRRDLERAGIVGPEPPECPGCGNLIGDEDAHADDCPESDLTPDDLAELEQEPSRTWDDVKEDPTPSEAERYGLDTPEDRDA